MMEWQAKEDAEAVMKKQLPENELQVFANLDSDKNVVWEEEGEEFYYSGSLYDVVKKEVRDGKIFYYCYNDKNEAQVFDGLQNLLYSQINDERSASGAVHKYLLKTFDQNFLIVDRFFFSTKMFEETPNKKQHFFKLQPKVFFEIISPPPELS